MKAKVHALKVSPATILDDIERLCTLAEMPQALARGANDHSQGQHLLALPISRRQHTPWQMEGTILALKKSRLRRRHFVQNKTVVTNAFKGEDLNHYLPLFQKYKCPFSTTSKRATCAGSNSRPKARCHVLHRIFPTASWFPIIFFGKNIAHAAHHQVPHLYSHTGAMKNAFGGSLWQRSATTPMSWIHRTLVAFSWPFRKRLHPASLR